MKITIEVSDETRVLLDQLLQRCAQSDEERRGANTHGLLTVEGLLEMLAEDCALAVRRSGSWEGANMIQVLTSHGYCI